MKPSISRLGQLAVLAFTVLFAAASCNGWGKKDDASAPAATPAPRIARAAIEGRSSSKLAGEAVFTEVDGKVHVVVAVTGAPPGKHAVHVHEKGDCSAPDASSAGTHFNPDGQGHPHGDPGAAKHHAGDFGNMEVGADGNGKLDLTVKSITVSAGPRSVVGRAIIVHEKPDDFSQPVGNAGGRIGCGVINAQ